MKGREAQAVFLGNVTHHKPKGWCRGDGLIVQLTTKNPRKTCRRIPSLSSPQYVSFRTPAPVHHVLCITYTTVYPLSFAGVAGVVLPRICQNLELFFSAWNAYHLHNDGDNANTIIYSDCRVYFCFFGWFTHVCTWYGSIAVMPWCRDTCCRHGFTVEFIYYIHWVRLPSWWDFVFIIAEKEKM